MNTLTEKSINEPIVRVRKRRRNSSTFSTECKRIKLNYIEETDTIEDFVEIAENKSEEILTGNIVDNRHLKKQVSVCLPPPCHCTHCYVYMGETNPRQYCRKTYCDYQDWIGDEIKEIQEVHLMSSPYYYEKSFIGYKDYHQEIKNFIDKIK